MIILISLLFIISSIFFYAFYQRKNNNQLPGVGGLDQANKLIFSYARHIGTDRRGFDENMDISFGSTGFHYNDQNHMLIARIYVSPALIADAPANELANYRKMVVALNDPKIGGMFENNGAKWILIEDMGEPYHNGAYFMTKEFPLASTNARSLQEEMDKLTGLSAIWTVKWLFRVAMILHGHEPAPTSPVTLKNGK